MPDYKTPGVYIVEENAFPSSAVAVETAVPVFIGYTQKAERNGKSLSGVPTRISSMAEYAELFGGAFKPTFTITADAAGELQLNNKPWHLDWSPNNKLYFYSCIRFFYLNGGANCYILSVGSYEEAVKGIDIKRFTGDATATPPIPDVFTLLEKEYEPTLVLLPDVVALADTTAPGEIPTYYALYQKVLEHCNKTQSLMGIFDVARSADGKNETAINAFREGIGNDFLKYGAAYYPWLQTSVIDANEIDLYNLAATVKLSELIPAAETQAMAIINVGPGDIDPLSQEDFDKLPDDAKKDTNLIKENIRRAQNAKVYHTALMASSPTYKKIMEEIRNKMNLLPPSSAMAGIYTLVDNSRGVWKAPANVSVAATAAPEVNISNDEQQSMNVDPLSGKSINIIRAFPGIGTLVWGGRTLDGNSQDWRYINVRRTMMMIEQSLKLATRAFVFEPNDNGTWVTIKSMMNNFLNNLWKQGALAGADPAQAYSIQVGLGATMTPNDILDGILRVTVLVAVVRPAEFIEISFQQQMQRS